MVGRGFGEEGCEYHRRLCPVKGKLSVLVLLCSAGTGATRFGGGLNCCVLSFKDRGTYEEGECLLKLGHLLFRQ